MTSERAVNILVGTVVIGLIAILVISPVIFITAILYDRERVWKNFAKITLAELGLLTLYVAWEFWRLVNQMADALMLSDTL